MTRMTGHVGISLPGWFLGSTWTSQMILGAPTILAMPVGMLQSAATLRDAGLLEYPERPISRAWWSAGSLSAGGRWPAKRVIRSVRGGQSWPDT
jgi:hypothetical protein